MSRRGWGLGLVVVVGLLVVGLLAGQPRRSGPPLDPRSTDPDGTRALVVVLGQLGGDVQLDRRVPGPGDDVALVLRDDLTAQERTTVLDWVSAGGTLVVADAASSLHPGRVAGGHLEGELPRGACTVAALGAVGSLAPGEPTPLFEAPVGSAACFRTDDGAFVVVTDLRAGVVVALASPAVLTNAQLGRAGNAVLAASLLAPRPGTRVLVVERARPGASGGTASLSDLVSDGVWAGMAQLVVAFVVLAAARGRRLGRPVAELQPVELPGSRLVEGVGHLMARAGHRAVAAGELRAGLRADAARALGLDAHADTDRVVDGLVALLGLGEADARRAVGEGPVGDDRELVAVARAVVAVRAGLRPVPTAEPGAPAHAAPAAGQDAVPDEMEVLGG